MYYKLKWLWNETEGIVIATAKIIRAEIRDKSDLCPINDDISILGK